MNISDDIIRSIPKTPEADPIIKICGITNVGDALLSVKLGADLLGFNFYSESSRYVTQEVARSILWELPPGIRSVGVFVNESVANVIGVANELKLDAIQLHGDETVEIICELRNRLDLDVLKAIRVGPEFDVEKVDAQGATAVLLDSYSSTERGGTGRTFKWSIAYQVQCLGHFVYLAGGLSPGNVSQAIREGRPHGVDVCSGVESEPGKKDPEKLKRFFDAVRETI